MHFADFCKRVKIRKIEGFRLEKGGFFFWLSLVLMVEKRKNFSTGRGSFI
ncbi:hypothetical protein SLEP1_g55588 [Rubroshorea leprosula]|uniref:Uncharacterized protein n=1 Tax=Rubroshorea leprosula TaxID=152421 RepID=A0AAV5MFY3_9ROSI|nr:hypothetical protein SLEP1_g55588 [Rubroshorea leprosula]